MRSIPSVPFACVLVAALSLSAVADVDITVGNADKIKGSIASSETRDLYRITCPAGATLKVKAKGLKGLRPGVSIERPEPGGGPKKGATTLVDGPLPTSGVHFVEIAGTSGTSGDYALAISYKIPKKTSTTVTLGGDDAVVPFAASAGTTLKVKVKQAKGSAAVPRILRIEGPDGYQLDLQPGAKSSIASLGKTVLPNDGDYRVVLDDAADAGGGAAAVTVQLKQPKPAKRKLDLRGRAIGAEGGERLAVSDVVDETGGSVGVPFPGEGGPDSLISGSNVVVPAGALTSPTPIIVATSSDVKPKGDAAGAGPSVFFGPEGLRFAEDVAVTIPFDATQFDGNFANLEVYTRDAGGKVRLVEGPYDIDADAGTCSFQVSHFSSFRVARAGAGAAIGELVGAWRQVTDLDPTDRVWLVILENGGVETVVASTESEFCIRTLTIPGGSPIDQILEIVDGRLRFTIDGEIGPQYERANIRDVPTDCQQF
jgi:hypothetical protein